MNAAAFAQVMKNPGLLRNYSLSELQELALRHPYASTVYSMVALKAHLEGDGNYEHYLNQAAIRIPDRKRLYHLIHSDYEYAFADVMPLQEKPLTAEQDFETVVPETAKVEAEEMAAEEPRVLKEERVEEEPRIVEEPKVEPEPGMQVQEDVEDISGVEEQPLVETQPEPHQPVFDPEEELESAKEEEPVAQQEMPVQTEEVDEEKVLDLPGTNEVLDALNAIRSFKPDNSVQKTGDIVEEIRSTVTPKKPVEPPVSKDRSAHSFTEWLSLLKGEKPAEPVQEEQEEIPIEPPPFDLENPPPIVSNPLSIKAEQVELEELPVETEEEKELDEIITAKQAKASLAQDDELVTETLAQIYELQKKYEKAIKAYQTLSLKYPDKRAYFAEKIAKLKTK